jgi:uncharacterized membrane protein
MKYGRRVLINVLAIVLSTSIIAVVGVLTSGFSMPHSLLWAIVYGVAIVLAIAWFVRASCRLIINSIRWKTYLDTPVALRDALDRIDRQTRGGYIG